MELITTEKKPETNEPRVVALKAKHSDFEQRYCEHKHLTAHAAFQMLQCDDCKKMISPWEYVWDIALERYVLDNAKKELTEKIAELDKRLQELRHEEQNIKARMRNAKKKSELFV